MATQHKYARRRFTVVEYHKMGEAGIITEDDRVELIDGEIVEMSPINPPHSVCVNRLNKLLNRHVPEELVVSVQNPIYLSEDSEPQPDIALLKPGEYISRTQHPGPEDVLLVVEVADTTVVSDQRQKIPRYAQAGIPEAWLVNIPKGVVEVYTDPGQGKYKQIKRVGPGESITPKLLPDVTLQVSDFLPRQEERP